METTTDDNIIRLRLKVVIPIIGSLLVVSNLFTRYISVLDQNTDKIQYSEAANKRRIKNASEKIHLEIEIKMLNLQLNECKDGK